MHPRVSQGEGCGGQLLPTAPRDAQAERPLRVLCPQPPQPLPARPRLAGVFSLLIFSCSFK